MCDSRWNEPLQGRPQKPLECWTWLASEGFQTEFERQQAVDNPFPGEVFRDRTNAMKNWQTFSDTNESQHTTNEDGLTYGLFGWCSVVNGKPFVIGKEHYWLLGYQWPMKGDQNRGPIADLVAIRPNGGLTVFECKVDADRNKNLCCVICGQALAYLACLTGANNFDKIQRGFDRWRERKAACGMIPKGFEETIPRRDVCHEAVVLAVRDWFSGYHKITDQIRECVQARLQPSSRVAIGFAATTFIKTTCGEWMDGRDSDLTQNTEMTLHLGRLQKTVVSGRVEEQEIVIDGYRYCKNRQIAWAVEGCLPLIGSKGNRGEPAYTTTLDVNLFESLSPEARRELEQGDGEELVEKGGPCKMQAVHSSAALTVNVFHYWRHQQSLQPILAALGLPGEDCMSVAFEAKRPIMDSPNRKIFGTDPNLDVVIQCSPESRFREIAVECKFTEPYRPCKPEDKALKWQYLKERQLWEDIPACHDLARRIMSSDDHFQYLHAAQLVKHILGLKHRNGKDGFHLIYLWYDVPLEAADQHRLEIEEFQEIVTADGIAFSAVAFQEVIAALQECRSGHEKYVEYLVERYIVPDHGPTVDRSP